MRKGNTFFQVNHLQHATIFNKRYLLFGSLQQGLIMTDYDGNVVDVINEKDGLLDHNILSLYKDNLGNIWTAVDGSAAYIELNSPFTILNKKNGLRGEIYCMLQRQDRLYIGTNRGLYAADWSPQNPRDIEFELIPNTVGQCWQLFEHQENVLLAHHGGIYVVENNRARLVGGGGNWNFLEIPGNPDLLLSGKLYWDFLTQKGVGRL